MFLKTLGCISVAGSVSTEATSQPAGECCRQICPRAGGRTDVTWCDARWVLERQSTAALGPVWAQAVQKGPRPHVEGNAPAFPMNEEPWALHADLLPGHLRAGKQITWHLLSDPGAAGSCWYFPFSSCSGGDSFFQWQQQSVVLLAFAFLRSDTKVHSVVWLWCRWSHSCQSYGIQCPLFITCFAMSPFISEINFIYSVRRIHKILN